MPLLVNRSLRPMKEKIRDHIGPTAERELQRNLAYARKAQREERRNV